MMEVTKIEDLFTANGFVNSAIVRRDWFLKTPLYRDIMDKSRPLDVFPQVDIGHRIWFVKDGLEVDVCEMCGKPRLVMPKGHGNHTFTLCSCHRRFNEDSQRRLLEHRENTRRDLLADIMRFDHSPRLSQKEFDLMLEYMNSRKANYQFMVSRKYKDFYSDLIYRTKDVLPVDTNDMPQRLYIASKGLDEIPTCPCCGSRLNFHNRFVGYGSCPCTEQERSQETRAKSYLARIPMLVNQEKYDIVRYPVRLTDGMIIRCKSCGKESTVNMTCGKMNVLNHNSLLCKHCEFCNGVSKTEKDIACFIREVVPDEDVVENDRKVLHPKELDIYIPGRKLAFEYDGMYWHCESWRSDRNSHLNKTLACERQGIHLVHIFENEWLDRQDIVKSRMRNLLGSYDKVVYARNCEVGEVPSKLALEFQYHNHVQGGVNSKVNLGLYHDGELVSLMTFSKPRFNRNYEWELVRFCNRLNWHVPGGASRLLSHFERTFHPRSIVSYADRRWSMDSEHVLYRRLGFELKSVSQPNYWYVKNGELFNRVTFQKHKLKGLLDKFDESRSEWQNMQDNGYDRIFDCGNLVFVKEFTPAARRS